MKLTASILEERLVDFSVMVLTLAGSMQVKIGAKNMASQLSRSGTAPALNYAEARGAESPRDFVHKLRICLKELSETHVCLRVIQKMDFLETDAIGPVSKECDELISIFVVSIRTKENSLNR